MENLYIKFEEGNVKSLNDAVIKAKKLGCNEPLYERDLGFEGTGILMIYDDGDCCTSVYNEEELIEKGFKEYLDISTKNSGDNLTFEGGAKRENKESKIRYDLIPLELLESIAQKYTDGANIYGVDNWRKGNQEFIDGCKASAFRHFIQWLRGDTDENHEAAVVWNIYTYKILTEKKKFN